MQRTEELLHGAVRPQVHAERGRRTFARQGDRRQAARRYRVVVL